jgi:membrane protein
MHRIAPKERRLAPPSDHKAEPPDDPLRRTTWQSWLDVMVQTGRDLRTSNVTQWAASLAFYAVLSLFPLLIGSMVIASYIVDVSWATDQAIDLLAQFLPEGEEGIEDIVTQAIEQRQRVGIMSFLVVLVTGRRILGGLTKGLNHVSDVSEQEDTIKRKALVELALAAGLAVLIGLSLASRRLLDLLWETVRFLPGPDSIVVDAIGALVRALLLYLVFLAVYAFVPQGPRSWRAVAVGAGLATTLYLAAQFVFALFVDSIWANLSLIYGPLALAALLLTWSWYVALITLVGASFASHVKVMIIERQGSAKTSQQHTTA